MLDVPPKLQKWDERSRPLIAVAALAPFLALAIVPGESKALFVVIDFASWSVFLTDFVVRVVLWRRYPNTGNGVFDLSIVVFTFPWYVFPVASGARFLSIFRIARLIKLMTSTKLVRRIARLARRFGALGIWILGASIFSALVVLNVEPPSSGFEDFGDAIWWAMVSFTTVGYGDLIPVTALGRFAAVLMMLTGLAALGSVAAILASSFGEEDREALDLDPSDLVNELKDLKEQVAELSRAISDDTRRG
jgi:voltage-gated potassium channel